MKIGDRVIRVPEEDPLGYEMDWRWQVAQAVVEAAGGGRIPWALVQDADARALVQHLQHRKQHPLKDGDTPRQFDRVGAWRDSPGAALIEAFLLASDSYADAARELGIPPEDVRLYARLYVDLHDDQGKRRPAVLMRLRGTPDVPDEPDMAARLRRVALTGGVHGLRQLLQAATLAAAPTLDEMVEQELKRRLVAGELRTSDLTRLQANSIAKQRVAQEQEGDDLRETEGWAYARKLLALMAPHVVSQRKTAEETAASTEVIRARIESQRNVAATPLLTDEPDKGYQALTELINKGFKTGEA